MLKLLTRIFIKDRENVNDPKVRGAYGILCGVYGIVLNLLLFAGKYIAGSLSGSMAIIADGFNSLSDAGSSILSLLGFALAGKKPDPDHPFGHGRIEYLTGLMLSVIIITVGFELLKSSLIKIVHPEPVVPGLLPALILLVSIIVKMYMAGYNRKIGAKINSAAMQASAADSASDSIATAVVLLSMGISFFFDINIDAYAGLLVSGFIILGGFGSAKDTISPLLGQAPDPELVKGIEDIVLSHCELLGVHDLVVHDYGPGRLMASLHAEVDGKGDIFVLHDVIDRAENEIFETYGCIATIHMDPLDMDNSELFTTRREITKKLKELNGDVTIHDFRMVPGTTHTNFIFDAVFPVTVRDSDEELTEKIQALLRENWPDCCAVVKIDRDYKSGI